MKKYSRKDNTISYQQLFDAYESILKKSKREVTRYTEAIAEYEAAKKEERRKVEVNKDWVKRRENNG